MDVIVFNQRVKHGRLDIDPETVFADGPNKGLKVIGVAE